jgi:hypothetical protein
MKLITQEQATDPNINNGIAFMNTYKTIILPVETWSLTLREEHRLRVFENRVLRRIF